MSNYAELFGDRYGTAMISDAAFRAGVEIGLPAPGLAPLDLRSKLAGPAMPVEANNDLVSILEAVHRADRGDVVVIANEGPDAGLMGDLIGTEAVRKGLAGFVVDGLVRDAVKLIDLGVQVLCRGTYPVGPLKVAGQPGLGVVGDPVSLGGAAVRPGAWVFGDADGVVVLGAEALPTVFERAAEAYAREEVLAAAITAGTALADAFALETFLGLRGKDPDADFREHLEGLGRAI